MKLSAEPHLELNASKIKIKITRPQLIQNHNRPLNVIDLKFYQKFFTIIISFSTFLIVPESVKELENLCESFHSSKICNVW